MGYGYDSAGHLTQLTYPNGQQVTRSYDAADRLTGVSDWLGHSTQFAYDAAGNVITQTYPNTTTASFSYNAANQLTGLVDKQGGSTLWSYSYGRDALGGLSSSADPLDGQTHTYGYSPLSQLTSDQRSSGGTTSWTADGASQVTQRVDPTGPATSTLSYDAASELSSLRAVSGTTTTKNLTLSYNADGDRTAQSDSVSGASSSYGYDQEDRPITATSGLTPSSYAYDGDGLRQSKTVSGTTTAETWATAAELPQLVQDGSTRYVPGPDGAPLEQIASDGTVLYYYQDQLGSTRGLLNGSGQTVATDTYDPYGKLTASTGSVRTPFGFAGQYTDAETGWQYLRARSYDPATMQFMSVDPLVDQTGQPYAYAAANPLNLGDPTGLQCNGAQGQGWARFGSSFGDLGCNIGELKDWALTHRNNGTTTGTVVEVSSFIFGPVTVAGAPSSACDPAYEAQVAQDQQALNTEASNANWFVGLTLGGAGAVRGVAGLVGGLRGAADVAASADSNAAAATAGDASAVVAPAKRATGQTVLGRYPAYVQLSEKLVARRFDIPPAVWDRMTEAEQWAANLRFLDRTIQRGDEIILASPATAQSAPAGSFFRRELDYLFSKGYRLSSDGTRLVPGG